MCEGGGTEILYVNVVAGEREGRVKIVMYTPFAKLITSLLIINILRRHLCMIFIRISINLEV